MRSIHSFLPRDFIATHDDLIFAVLSHHLEDNRILAFLRYTHSDGIFHKQDTHAANAYLAQHHPEYLFDSKLLAARVHAVPLSNISHHYRPGVRLAQLLQETATDTVVKTAQYLCQRLADEGIDLGRLGITGSLLIGAQHAASDIDLVVYDRTTFFQTRTALHRLMGQGLITELCHTDWLNSYTRRGCTLNFEEYVWHEKRKMNKGMMAGIKFDISLVLPTNGTLPEPAMKSGYHTLTARVTDSMRSFDYPAVYAIDHPEVTEVWSFIQTYAGQARDGERIEASGQLETEAYGLKRLIVGSSREAPGEYIKVIPHTV